MKWRRSHVLGTAGVVAALALASGGARAGGALAVEYHHAPWDHYFVTANVEEIAFLDAGAFGGLWRRTGESFVVETSPAPPLQPTCRFFGALGDKSSHFHTPFAAECAKLQSGGVWRYEGTAFYLQLPDGAGNCAPGTTVLYRLYNRGMGSAPNHRYTTRRAIVDAMSRGGWELEGNGPDAVLACAPSSSVAFTPRGLWFGTSSADESVLIAVLANDAFYIVYSKPSAPGDAGVVVGTTQAAAGQIVSGDASEFAIPQASITGDVAVAASITGAYAPQSEMALDLTDARGTRHIHATYADGAVAPRDLAALAGNYGVVVGHVGRRTVSGIRIDAAGNLRGSDNPASGNLFDPPCTFAGTITPRPMEAVFDWVIRPTGGVCAFGGDPIAGILYFDAAKGEVHAFAPYGDRTDLYFVIGSRF